MFNQLKCENNSVFIPLRGGKVEKLEAEKLAVAGAAKKELAEKTEQIGKAAAERAAREAADRKAAQEAAYSYWFS